MTAPEGWTRAYRDAPDVFAAFVAAEDPDGRVRAALAERLRPAGLDVLEVGCGTGRLARWLHDQGARITALDRAPALLAQVPGGPALLRADGRHLPFRAGAFDHTVAAWVVLNSPDAARPALLAEMARTLRSGGRTWLVENHPSGEFHALRGEPEDEVRRLRELVQVHGFREAAVVDTELRFPDGAQAARILGTLLGEVASTHLRGRAVLGHRVVILERPT